jgi:predicted  nucleic acid-binding Zn-ribbon protein
VLADFQGSQESEIEFALAGMKKKVEEGEREVDVWRGKAEHAENRVHKMEKSVPDAEKLRGELDEALAASRKLKMD